MGKSRGFILPVIHFFKYSLRMSFVYLLLIYNLVILSSCGIDEYIYFAPVTNYNFQSSSELTSFTLPGASIQDGLYCTNYTLYYRIYRSTVDYPWPTTNEFSEINQQLSKDYSAITTNTDDESKIMSSISYLESNFSRTSFFPPSDDPQLKIDDSNRVDLLSRDNLGPYFFDGSFKIDFQLTATSYVHPVIIFDSVNPEEYYRIAREQLSDTTQGRDFLNPSQIKGSDTVLYSSTTDGSYAYVLFYISANGLNTMELSTVNSAPCFLGIFRIDNL